MEICMSFFKQRFASTDLSGYPFHPDPVDDPADDPVDEPRHPPSRSSAAVRQPAETSLSELTPPAAARQADLVCLADIDYLSEGTRSQYNVETAARRDGICITTLRRAKFDLGVVSIKESISGYWFGPSRKTSGWPIPRAPKRLMGAGKSKDLAILIKQTT
jgi:hypothetical protein